MSALLLTCLLLGAPEPAADTVVVLPAELATAFSPWIEFRQGQGHRVAVVEASDNATALRRAIRDVAARGALKYIVLVGDCGPDIDNPPNVSGPIVPTHLAAARVNVQFGSEPQIATDNWYADLDDDGVPEVAVGRLPADSAEELATIVAKVLAYERNADWSRWRQRINVVAGVGGFGAAADSLIESSARMLLTAYIPASYRTTMTYADWRSPYCPGPACFAEATLERLNEGCLFWVYLGHGNRREVDWVRAPDGDHPILSSADVARLNAAKQPPIALLLSCYTGAYDGPEDCLAEDLIRAPGGPVAVVAGSRVTMPYSMTVLGTELLQESFQRQQPTVGEWLLAAKRGMALGNRDSGLARQIDGLARMVYPRFIDLAEERAEHALLFNLLGDPLLTLRYPHAVELTVSDRATAGETVEITGSAPLDGTAELELVLRRDRLPADATRRDEYNAAARGNEQSLAAYRQANDLRLTTQTVPVVNGQFTTRLSIPDNAWGPCHLRVFIEGSDGYGLGSTDIEIRPARTAAAEAGAAR